MNYLIYKNLEIKKLILCKMKIIHYINKIVEQNNFNKTNLLNKYAQALHLGKHELKNITNELLNYKNISKDLQFNLNSLKMNMKILLL